MVKPVPDAYHSAIPYLIVSEAVSAIEWYKKAFGATEMVRLVHSAGKVMHAELRIGRSTLMLADEFPDMGYRSPLHFGGSPVSMLLYVEDVDEVFGRAVAAGGTETVAVADSFDGDRRGTLTDPFGHLWLLASKKEDISLEELGKRFDELMKGEA